MLNFLRLYILSSHVSPILKTFLLFDVQFQPSLIDLRVFFSHLKHYYSESLKYTADIGPIYFKNILVQPLYQTIYRVKLK